MSLFKQIDAEISNSDPIASVGGKNTCKMQFIKTLQLYSQQKIVTNRRVLIGT
jgi:hypothetical protein